MWHLERAGARSRASEVVSGESDDVLNKITHSKHPFEAFLGPTVYVRNSRTEQVTVVGHGFKLFYAFRSWNFGRDAFFFKHYLLFLDEERRLVRFNVLQADSASNDCQVLFEQLRTHHYCPRLETFQLVGTKAYLLFENGELMSYDISRKKFQRFARLFLGSIRPDEDYYPVFTTIGFDGTNLLAACVPEFQQTPLKDEATVYLLDCSTGSVKSELTVAYSHLFQGTPGSPANQRNPIHSFKRWADSNLILAACQSNHLILISSHRGRLSLLTMLNTSTNNEGEHIKSVTALPASRKLVICSFEQFNCCFVKSIQLNVE